jgi:hypothetical protein
MKKEKLEQHLFSSTTKLYCVLDGASVPDLPKRLYETQAPNFCLFTGDLAPDMLYVAPYVVFLSPDNKLTDLVLSESFGKHWGIFVHCRHSLKEMRRHFRSMVDVYDENANSMVFRFYDPRVIRQFLPTCTPDELEIFFGKVESFFAEAENGESLLQYQLADQKLKQTELN